MKIVQEEIFGPVGVVIKFEDEEDVIRQANDTSTVSPLPSSPKISTVP
jgi:acyl-CoA reductase-like NAD-dependent aldehyde dehydrogenase